MANSPSPTKFKKTIRVERELWARALTRAAEDGTDVTAVLVRALTEYAARGKDAN